MAKKSLANEFTVRDEMVFRHHEVDGKTIDQTANLLGVSRDTVKRTKKKPAYRQYVLDALEAQGYTVDRYVSQLIAMTTAEKTMHVGNKLQLVPDNHVRMKALKKICDIYGADAPKHLDLSHYVDDRPTEELFRDALKAVGLYEDEEGNIVEKSII